MTKHWKVLGGKSRRYCTQGQLLEGSILAETHHQIRVPRRPSFPRSRCRGVSFTRVAPQELNSKFPQA